ncbi:MAG: tRNA uridine-5-carboxymethylaminomethyl(34) synthesis enzyme MnmG, partial [Alphaproteobacteria bacterium]|nr:tRNA uridine-5-carboxymethylaminomethyl(34) synthesis enzyme MnmG [Alphaproteobacteria bacterium]
RAAVWAKRAEALAEARDLCASLNATPNQLLAHNIQVNMDGQRRNVAEVLRYPEVTWEKLCTIWPQLFHVNQKIAEQIVIDAQYVGYIERQELDIEAYRKEEGLILPADLDYKSVGSLSTEVRTRLEQVRPVTLGAAARIPGVTPAAIIALLRHVRKAAA